MLLGGGLEGAALVEPRGGGKVLASLLAIVLRALRYDPVITENELVAAWLRILLAASPVLVLPAKAALPALSTPGPKLLSLLVPIFEL